jgi:hypothetical protein
MFVAHKKLQAGKECTQPSEKFVAKKAKPSKVAKFRVATVKPVALLEADFANESEAMTLNARILEAGPATAFFTREEESSSDDSIVTKLVAFVRCTIYTFIGLPS